MDINEIVELWRFSFVRVAAPAIDALLERAVHEMSDFYREPYRLWRDGVRILSLRRQSTLFAIAATLSKPPLWRVVAVDLEGAQVYFWNRDDPANELASKLNLTGDFDAVMLHEVARGDYGALSTTRPPERFLGQQDAREWDIALTANEELETAEAGALWWQEWGGLLFSLAIKKNAHYKFGQWKLLRHHVGRFKRIPFRR